MSINATKVLHDYLYKSPEHPVPFAGDVVELDYPARPDDVAVKLSTNQNCIAALTITASADDMTALVDSARRALARDYLEGGQAGPGGSGDGEGASLSIDDVTDEMVASARIKLGNLLFDDNVADTVRAYLTSAAILRTRVFPLLSGETNNPADVAPGADYTFEVRFPLQPRAQLSSYDAVEITVPEQMKVTPNALDRRMMKVAKAQGALGADGKLPPEDSDAYAAIEARAQRELEYEANVQWSESVTSLCLGGLSGRLEGEAPQPTVLMAANDLLMDFAQRIDSQGVGWQQFLSQPGVSLDQLKKNFISQAVAQLGNNMALDAMAEHMGIMISKRDLFEAVGEDPADAENVLRTMMLTGQLPQLCQVVLRNKTAGVVAKRALKKASGEEEIPPEVAAAIAAKMAEQAAAEGDGPKELTVEEIRAELGREPIAPKADAVSPVVDALHAAARNADEAQGR